MKQLVFLLTILPALGQISYAQDHVELAKKLANPVASLISVPFQLNYDHDIGPDDSGERYLLNIQPVLPFSLSKDWNIISRSIIPVIYQDDIYPGSGSQSGLGDLVQSIFISPKATTRSGWIWGAGPVMLVPTATDRLLGSDKWGLGPTAVALKQGGPWTYGILANHIWSVAGDDDRRDVSATYLQPFIVYTTKGATSCALNTESTYDWESDQWGVPINLTVNQVLKVGNQIVNVAAGVHYWAESTDSGPEGWGGRLMFTLMFPK